MPRNVLKRTIEDTFGIEVPISFSEHMAYWLTPDDPNRLIYPEAEREALETESRQHVTPLPFRPRSPTTRRTSTKPPLNNRVMSGRPKGHGSRASGVLHPSKGLTGKDSGRLIDAFSV